MTITERRKAKKRKTEHGKQQQRRRRPSAREPPPPPALLEAAAAGPAAGPAASGGKRSRGEQGDARTTGCWSDPRGGGGDGDDDGNGCGDGSYKGGTVLLEAARAKAGALLLVDREVREQQQRKLKRSRTDHKVDKASSKRKGRHISDRRWAAAAASASVVVGLACGRSAASQALRTDCNVPTATRARIQQRRERRMMDEIKQSLRGVVATQKPATSGPSSSKSTAKSKM
jgi:hypothetical protein